MTVGDAPGYGIMLALVERGLVLVARGEAIEASWEKRNGGSATPLMWAEEAYDGLIAEWARDAREALRNHYESAPALTPGHTDLMVTPESLDAFMDANPLPEEIAVDDAPPERIWIKRQDWEYYADQPGGEVFGYVRATPSAAARLLLESPEAVERMVEGACASIFHRDAPAPAIERERMRSALTGALRAVSGEAI